MQKSRKLQKVNVVTLVFHMYMCIMWQATVFRECAVWPLLFSCYIAAVHVVVCTLQLPPET
jgi:hypothetical protein